MFCIHKLPQADEGEFQIEIQHQACIWRCRWPPVQPRLLWPGLVEPMLRGVEQQAFTPAGWVSEYYFDKPRHYQSSISRGQIGSDYGLKSSRYIGWIGL